MKFGEKLDMLMKITDTSNIALARSVSLDASFISRLRRGERTPSKNENYIMAIAAYFARNCSAEYQRAALSEALNVSLKSAAGNLEETAWLINRWLLAENTNEANTIESLVNNIAQFGFKKPLQHPKVEININKKITSDDTQAFYGIKGKQDAVVLLYSLILSCNNPQTILLYSDESMDWLTENPEFTAKWAALFSQVIARGNKVKIIHSVTRSLEELLSAVKEWLPIYMTGAIEPYYYPKLRDRVFKRTLFIAPETAAVSSNSIGDETSNAANFLFTNKDTVSALNQEFEDLLSLCRPLMRIFTPESKEGFLSVLEEFNSAEGDSIIKSDLLSTITMPMDVAESILSRMENDKKAQALAYHEMSIRKFNDSLQRHKFTEIITLPDINQIQDGQVMLSFSDLFSDRAVFLTPEEFCRHLKNIIRLLKTFDNYSVCLMSVPGKSIPMIYAKEGVGVIFGKTTPPSVIFATNENNMSAAFWEYVCFFLHKEASGSLKKASIEKLEEVVKIIESTAFDMN